MSNTLDFNKIKKKYLTVVFADEKNTTIMIGTPTKGVMEELMSLQESLNTVSDDVSAESMGELYDVCAKVMSRNKTNKKIEKEYLESVFDLEDITIFLHAYMEFIDTLSAEKN